MRRSTIFVVFLILCANGFLLAQGNQSSSKPKKVVQKTDTDCSKIDDAALAANVKDKIAATPSLKDASINVTAKDGTVTLSGSVKKPTNKGLATLQAKRVPCVRKVDNQLTVEGKPAVEKKPKT
jgi:osmotically-inducible protein OsmY